VEREGEANGKRCNQVFQRKGGDDEQRRNEGGRADGTKREGVVESESGRVGARRVCPDTSSFLSAPRPCKRDWRGSGAKEDWKEGRERE